ncbi:hypothetical protein [Halobacillus sp. BAB-2008]|uniref:hypothetical protein n=1 Tax=Halobacillus sp. BAB-2008 TaxID=1246484 RepID=UPI0002D7BBF3|nr:hypothetical protein [Halobacillus sp. BAB-2008]
MKISQLDYKAQHVIDQLSELGFEDTEGLSYDELVRKLAMARALEVDISSDKNKWF